MFQLFFIVSPEYGIQEMTQRFVCLKLYRNYLSIDLVSYFILATKIVFPQRWFFRLKKAFSFFSMGELLELKNGL